MTVTLGQWIRSSRRGAEWPAEWQRDPRRASPAGLPAHVGVWLDRCLWESRAVEVEGKPGRQALYEAAIASLRGSGAGLQGYRALYGRWRRNVEEGGPEVERLWLEIPATSRVLLHPATGSTVTEGAVLLHHSYGVPYLPGSALKGLCRAQARALEGIRDDRAEQDEEHRARAAWIRWLFGWQAAGEMGDEESQGEAGVVDFWDALLVPAPDGESALALDIVNPHHSDYYTRGGEVSAPGERALSPWDEPKPTHHLTVRPGAKFLVVLEMRRPQAAAADGADAAQWLRWVMEQLLVPALGELGIGARTAAGYGRLALPAAVAGAGAARAASAASVRKVHEEIREVTWEPGSETLRVGKALARQGEARRLLANLPEELRQRLARRKSARLRVKWEEDGNAARIVLLSPV